MNRYNDDKQHAIGKELWDRGAGVKEWREAGFSAQAIIQIQTFRRRLAQVKSLELDPKMTGFLTELVVDIYK